MALHPPTAEPQPAKLIFAPGEQSQTDAHQPSQAAQFTTGTLSRSSLSPSPFTQFHTWFSDPSLHHTVPETCTLSTASLPSGRVSARMVYLKELDSRGFVIYSNFGTSRKSQDLESNPYACLVFWWKALERQVRVEGKTERLSAQESQVYFDTRARGSRVGAWASRQSRVLTPSGGGEQAENGVAVQQEDSEKDDGRAELESQVRDIEQKFRDQDHIPVPPFWGGLRIIPDTVEFWQGRESRLHDRFRYTKVEKDGRSEEWKIERLSP